MNKPKKMGRSEYGPSTVKLLDIAFKDYLAARVLLNAGLLVQGAVLASTAVEKYFKAILAFRGQQSHGHLNQKHLNAAQNYDARLGRALNDQFVKLLQRSYRLCYLDDLESDFNLVIAGREFLAELDYTATMFQESFDLKQDGQSIATAYHGYKRDNDLRLIQNNFVISSEANDLGALTADKQSFISAEPQLVYEIRNCSFRGLLEAIYFAMPQTSDGQFLRSGFTRIDDSAMQYKMAFKPVPPETGPASATDRQSP